jgi:hypothetical protein
MSSLAQHGIKAKADQIKLVRPDIVIQDTLTCDKSGVFESDVVLAGDLTVTGFIKEISRGYRYDYFQFSVQTDLGVGYQKFYFVAGGAPIWITKVWGVINGTAVAAENRVIVSDGHDYLSMNFETDLVAGDVLSDGTGTPDPFLNLVIPKDGVGMVWCDGYDDNTNWVTVVIECYRPMGA